MTPRQEWKHDRAMKMLNMRFDGKTLQQVADYFGLSGAAVSRETNKCSGDYICNEGSKLFVPCCNLDN